MKRETIFAAIMVMFVLGGGVQAGISVLMNGSFEDNGYIADIAVEHPKHWCDVNIPTDKFAGWIGLNWKTRGNYSLTLYSGFATFTAGDMATVSQQVYLTDVNQIVFDLRLEAMGGYPWDPKERSGLLLIDGSVVWDSNDWAPDANSEYRDQGVEVNEIYKDANLHRLSLAIRANKGKTELFYEYLARWDFVKFDTHCGGFGYLPEDLNLDCYVDMGDLEVLAGRWLEQNPDYKYDLFQDEDDIVNLRDFAVLTDAWQDCTNWQDADCVEVKLLDTDLNDDGIVDCGDISVLAENWLAEGDCIRADLNEDATVNFQDYAIVTGDWSRKSWIYTLKLLRADLNDDGMVDFRDFAILAAGWMDGGPCGRGDIDGSGIIDYGDVAKLADQWLLRSW